MGPGMELPGRSLLYRENGRVVILSPGPFSSEDFKKIGEWGEVIAIVSTNLMHGRWIEPALKAFPNARFFRGGALGQKKPELKGQGEAYSQMHFLPIKDWEFIEIRGVPKADECVFYFPKDRTLFVTDLVFNIQRPTGALTKIILTLTGTKGRLAVSHALSFLAKDRKAFRQSLQKILQWNFSLVVMAHGEFLEHEAKSRLQAALKKFL